MTPRLPGPTALQQAPLPLPALPESSCLRIIAVHPTPATFLLQDAKGVVLAQSNGTSLSLLPAQGPLCLRKADGLVLKQQGPGEALVQLWAAP